MGLYPLLHLPPLLPLFLLLRSHILSFLIPVFCSFQRQQHACPCCYSCSHFICHLFSSPLYPLLFGFLFLLIFVLLFILLSKLLFLLISMLPFLLISMLLFRLLSPPLSFIIESFSFQLLQNHPNLLKIPKPLNFH